jgi:zinc and cadmium transporter
MDYLTVLFWSIIGSVFSLIGAIILLKTTKNNTAFVRYAMPFGAGALLAAAFLGLMPEATHLLEANIVAIWMLIGFLTFFILERGLSWFHHHHNHNDSTVAKNKTQTYLVVAGDTLHNAIDGIAIGAAFIVSPASGIAASIAIAAHEIPQEIGDFGILLSRGVKAKKAIIINLFSALATVVMAMLTFWLGQNGVINVGPLLAIAAGFFIYIAASDIIPDIHERPHKEALSQSILLIIGVLIIGSIITLTADSHSHDEEDHHGSESSEIHQEEPHND